MRSSRAGGTMDARDLGAVRPEPYRARGGSQHLQPYGDIYVVALSWNRGITEVIDWMSKTSVSQLMSSASIYSCCGTVMRPGSILKCHLVSSLVLGEDQILSQVKQVVRVGQGSGGLGKNIDRMFKDAITAGKRVRIETNISSRAVSVSSAAVELGPHEITKGTFGDCTNAFDWSWQDGQIGH